MTTRRTFLAAIPVSVISLSLGEAAAAVAVSEADPAAVALGYKADASKVDAKKYPAIATGRQCVGCQLYAGKPSDAAGPCGAFGGKLVSAKGWCVAWVKKG
jgi:hypothetical protein